jgi:soluble P-type ATPase
VHSATGSPFESSAPLICGLTVAAARDIIAERGAGLRGRLNGRIALVGSAAFLEKERVANLPRVARKQQAEATPVCVALDGVALGALELADELRDEAADAVAALRDLGVQTRIVSGDVRASVAAIAHRLGVDDYVAQATPESKAEAVRDLQRRGLRVAFVGDGINDAPALASADVGIAPMIRARWRRRSGSRERRCERSDRTSSGRSRTTLSSSRSRHWATSTRSSLPQRWASRASSSSATPYV